MSSRPFLSASTIIHDKDEDDITLCLMHYAPSPDNSTHVVMVDDDSVTDFGSTAVRRPFRVGASVALLLVWFGARLWFGDIL